MNKNLFYKLIVLLFTLFICDEYSAEKAFIEIMNSFNTDFLSTVDKTAQNIHTETIQYGLSYNNSSVVKVFIKLADDGIKNKVNFVGFLRTESEKKEYILNCSNPSNDLIMCYSKPGIKLDTDDKYYMYYNRSRKEKIIFDYENILEDDKRISLIFKPELYVNQTVYLDNKKIMAQINKLTVGEAYLYVVNKTKQILNLPKDRFNKYIELNHFVFKPQLKGFRSKNIYDNYEEALRRGYLMYEAEVQFTKDKIPIIYNKENNISEKYLKDLEKSGKILTLIKFLKMAKEKKAIIELKFTYLDSKEVPPKLMEYIDILLNFITKTDMFDSLFFNDDLEQMIISKLRRVKRDISVSINIDKLEDIYVYDILNKYKHSKRKIFNFNIDNIDEMTVNNITSLGHKIKVSTVNNIKLADKLQSWGVNYLTTNALEPFLIKNDKEEPYVVKCLNIFLDDLAECKMGPEIILRDNQFYNIHYSLNIYNISEDINETAIGEFRYEDTKINDNKYYIVKYIDFKRGSMQLVISHKVEKGKQIKGIIGPKFDNAAECYQFNFYCDGNDQNFIGCEIEKDSDKIEYNGEYEIYKLENYSFNEEEIEDYGLSKLKVRHIYTKQERMTYTIIIIIISFVFLCCSYYFQDRSNNEIIYTERRQKLKNIDSTKLPRKINFYTDVDKSKLMYE